MINYVKIFLFVLLIIYWFHPTKSQHCMTFSASTCEDQQSASSPSDQLSGSLSRGLPGKRGPTGRAGATGAKGEKGNPATNHIHKINELENTMELLQQNSNGTKTKLDEAMSYIMDLQLEISSLKAMVKKLKGTRYSIARTPTKGRYDEAVQMCVDMGGQLLQKCLTRVVKGVTYEREIRAILAMDVSNRAVWIGITDREEEGRWKYLNGEDFNGRRGDGEDLLYYWDHNQPQDVEDCAAISLTRMHIHDYQCDLSNDSFYGICEIEE